MKPVKRHRITAQEQAEKKLLGWTIFIVGSIAAVLGATGH